MNEQNFENSLQHLQVPNGGEMKNATSYKVALLNIKRSSSIGFIFIIAPCLFLAGVLMTHVLGYNFPCFSRIEEVMASMDKRAGIKWITPMLLIGLPCIGIAINLLAITHFQWNRDGKELIISIKYAFRNMLVLLISFLVISIFALYIITDIAHHS